MPFSKKKKTAWRAVGCFRSLNAVCYCRIQACTPSPDAILSYHRPGLHNLHLSVLLLPECAAMPALAAPQSARHQCAMIGLSDRLSSQRRNTAIRLTFYVARSTLHTNLTDAAFEHRASQSRKKALTVSHFFDLLTTVFILTCCTRSLGALSSPADPQTAVVVPIVHLRFLCRTRVPVVSSANEA